MSEIHSSSIKLKDLVGKFINPATGKPYTDRTLRHWCEDDDKMNFSIVDSAVTSLQSELIELYYSQVILDKLPIPQFLEAYATEIDTARNQSRQTGKSKPIQQEQEPQQVDVGDAEDAIYGVLAPMVHQLQAEVASVDAVCAMFEEKAALAIVSRTEQVAGNIAVRVMREYHRRQEQVGKPVSIFGAFVDAFKINSLAASNDAASNPEAYAMH